MSVSLQNLFSSLEFIARSSDLRLLDDMGKLQDSKMLRFKVKKPTPAVSGGPGEPSSGPCVFTNLNLPAGSQVPISIYAHNQGDHGLNTAALRIIGGCTPENQRWGLEKGDGATIYISGQ